MRNKRIEIGIIDAAFAVTLIAVAVMFFSWLAYNDYQHKADSELTLSGVYGVEYDQ